jgi:hypothetical protein
MVSSLRRRFLSLRLALALGAVGAACLLGPLASAEAVGVLHAAPDGTGSACTVEAPCALETAIEEAGENWVVALAPGTYEETQALVIPRAVAIVGEAGQAGPKPLIEVSGASVTAVLESTAAVTLRDLRVHSPAGTGAGIALSSTEASVERVESTGEAQVGCQVGGGTLRDSLCEAKSLAGVGVATSVPIGPAELKLANVTAIGGGHGLLGSAGPAGDLTVHALNTIASGGDEDVFAEGVGLGRITFDLSHSSFATVGSSGTEVSVTPNTEAGNLAAPPVFLDAAAGNYREAFGSPTYRAGDLAAVEAEREAHNSLNDYDLDGRERTTTCDGTTFVDIGAYQLGCPEPGHEEAQHKEAGGTPSGLPANAASSSPPAALPAPPPPVLAKVAARAQVKNGRALLRLTCPASGSCKGRLVLSVRSKKDPKGHGARKARATLRKIGTATFNLRARTHATVPVRLSARAIRLLKEHPRRGFKASLNGSGVKPGRIRLKATPPRRRAP